MRNFLSKFLSERSAFVGILGILVLLFIAIFAPLLANGRPFIMYLKENDSLSFPFLHNIFAPESTEYLIEQSFNYIMLWLIFCSVLFFLPFKKITIILFSALLLIPFILTSPKVDKTDYRKLSSTTGSWAIFAPIKYGPNEIIASSHQKPAINHLLGTDEVGRSVASRMIYGSRSSLAVGIVSTTIVLCIGTILGMFAGYFLGWFDIIFMRVVEILLCFPTFLLLLILMSALRDYKFEQSILVVIVIIGLTGWMGLAFLVRGEVLKQTTLPYIQSCVVAGIPTWRILLVHVLPNITAPIFISFTFGVAGAILAESSLSFLGFGVQPPTASWGGLLRQAFDNPLNYWHLMLFPGLALFWAVLSFNFTGEGLRKALNAK